MKNKKILIVEDENISAMSLQRKIEKIGFQVCGITPSAESAVIVAQEKRPDLVLMDINLKGKMDGIEAAEIIQRLEIPVVFLSALSDIATIERVKKIDAFGYLVKPIDEKSLQISIELALFKYKVQKELNQEIAARKIAEAELQKNSVLLRQSNEELEQFASIASHDLREPLRTVNCYLGLIERELQSQITPKLKEYFDFVRVAAPRMQKLVDDLLEFSRVGKQVKYLHYLDTNKIIANEVANLNGILSDEKAEICTEVLPKILGDEREIGQLFQNLISNAIKYHGEQHPVVHIRCTLDNGVALYSVSDNGIGIEAKELKNIFVVFKRLHTRQEYEGSGIGLATCKKIVESYGGKIWVESKLGEGSTFYFTLPESSKVNS